MNKTKILLSAQKYMRKGQNKKAIGEYEKILKEDPADVRARLNLANLHYRQKDFQAAVTAFLEVARIYEEGGFTLKAIAVYKQVLKVVPDRDDLYLSLAENYQKQGLLNEAGVQYREALKVLDARGDHLGELQIIRRMLDLDPGNIVDRLRLAEAFSAHGQITDAVREFRKVANALEEQGFTEYFQRIAERLLYHQPDDAVTALKLAASHVAGGEPTRALAKLKIAFRAAPRDLEVLRVLADAFAQLGQSHKATLVLKEMARLYERSGLEHERDTCYQEVLAINPDDETARRCVAPEVADEAGVTLVFEESQVDPPHKASRPREAPGWQAGQKTATMAPEDARRATHESLSIVTDKTAAPPRPVATTPTEDDAATEAAAEALIDQLIRDAIEADERGKPPRPTRGRPATGSSRVASETDLEALFAAALRDVENTAKAASGGQFEAGTASVASPPELPAEPILGAAALEAGDVTARKGLGDAPSGDADIDSLDFDDDGEEEVGFALGGEQTIVDNTFIPADLLAEVQSGVDLVVPSRGDRAGVETFAADEEPLRDDLQELDFYIANGLDGEAQTLLAELEERYRDHPYVMRRADTVRSKD